MSPLPPPTIAPIMYGLLNFYKYKSFQQKTLHSWVAYIAARLKVIKAISFKTYAKNFDWPFAIAS